MYCSNCGKMINNNMIFCPYCGHKVERLGTEVTEQAEPAVNTETPAAETAVTEAAPIEEIPQEAPNTEAAPAEEAPVSESSSPEPAPTESAPAEETTQEAPAPEASPVETEAEKAPAREASTEPAPEEAAPVAAEPAAEEKPKKKKTWLIILIVVVLAVCGVFGAKAIKEKQQEKKYTEAVSLLAEDKNYEEAIRLFDELGDYKDSAALRKIAMNELVMEEALSIFEEKDYKSAKEMFLTLGDYGNAPAYADLCDDYINYTKAQEELKKENFDDCLTLLKKIKNTSEFKDLTQMKNTCASEPKYRDGLALLEKKSYAQAYSMFASIITYKDAREKSQECIQPKPENAVLYQNAKYKSAVSELTFVLKSEFSYNTLLNVYTEDGSVLVATVYLAPGEEATLQITPGTYKITRAWGLRWFGETDMFGPAGTNAKYIDGLSTSGDNGVRSVETNKRLTITLY